MRRVEDLVRIRNEIIKRTMKVVEISNIIQESILKFTNKISRWVCRKSSDGGECSNGDNDRKNEAEVNGQRQARLYREVAQDRAARGDKNHKHPPHISKRKICS